MLKNTYVILLLSVFSCALLNAGKQSNSNFNWHNPAKCSRNVINNKVAGAKGYSRLPAAMKKRVSTQVWNLSQNSAGLSISFKTNSKLIIVRYQVNKPYSMPHMPATGVSGIDLYVKNLKGMWAFASGKYTFKDTIVYKFENIDQRQGIKNFKLYLPLYNTVKWLEIGVPDTCNFSFVVRNSKKPVIVLGTSIVQGACASRPGMAWTAIVERALDIPVINLGFSGFGLIQKNIIKMIARTDAELFILDCMPNMLPTRIDTKITRKRVIDAVKRIRRVRKNTPVIFTEHAGFTDQIINNKHNDIVSQINLVLNDAYLALKKQGFKNIYVLSAKQINLDINSTVDGVHPSDYGMVLYAEAYKKIIRNILYEDK